MKRLYKLENLECANCAAKMEEDIKKLDIIDDANIAFMTARLTLSSHDMPAAIEAAQKIVSKYEKDCRILV